MRITINDWIHIQKVLFNLVDHELNIGILVLMTARPKNYHQCVVHIVVLRRICYISNLDNARGCLK